MKEQAILLSTAYLPPVQYISKFLGYETVWLEAYENFTKQTYRNRAIILGANGPESLVIPVEKGRSKQLIRDLRISYDTNWQHIHWQAIVSAYNSSPFFEIIGPDFEPFYQKKYDFLFDFNLEIMKAIFEILEIQPGIKSTTDFEQVDEPFLNFREAIHPKPQKSQPDPQFRTQSYTQVFDDKYGFTANLCILDLLFNCGSESYSQILESFQLLPS